MSIGNLISFFVLVIGNRNSKLGYRPYINLRDPHLKLFFGMLVPVMLSSMISEINAIVDRNMAASLQVGTVSALNYSSRLISVITAFVGASIGKAMMPQMAQNHATGEVSTLRSQIENVMKTLIPVIVPLTIGVILLAEPIIRILFQRSNFTATDTIITAQCMRYYAIGLLSSNMNPIQIRVFYAMKKTKIPAVISVTAMSLNIVLNLALIGVLQHRGLALATSISACVSFVLFQVIIRSDLGSLKLYKHFTEWLKLVLALTVMSGVVVAGIRILPVMTGTYMQCLLSTVGFVGFAILVYGGLLIILKTEIAGMVIRLLTGLTEKRHKIADHKVIYRI
ncbi:hypothetical protein AGMMS49992_21040 [Clostridia bacterium]|nr:hypothetical protein AGMMS49992_21040 [Clostridia bacterium]